MLPTAHRILFSLLLVAAICAGACASSEDSKNVTYALSAKQNYERGLEELKKENYV